MKKTVSKITLLFTLIFVLVFSSCMKKDNADDPEFAAEDNTSANAVSDDALAVSESAMTKNNASMEGRYSEGKISVSNIDSVYKATITVTPKTASDSGRIVIDFGIIGITGLDNKIRKGKILISFTGSYRTSGKVQVITFDNYYVNDNKLEGKKILTHVIANSTVVTTISVTGAKLTYSDGTFTTWKSDRIRTWNPGSNLFSLYDDVVTVSGTYTGTSRNKVDYVALIDPIASPLKYTYSCAVVEGLIPVSGKITITLSGAILPRIIDFGNGNCDREATFIVGTKTIPFTIK